MDIDTLLERFGKDTGLGRLTLDDSGSYTFLVDEAKVSFMHIAEGLELIRSHTTGIDGIGFGLLRKHVPPEQCQRHLDHVVAQDAHMDDAIRTFLDLVESARIIEAGVQGGSDLRG